MHFDGYDYQYVIALDKGTGKTVWQRDRDVDYGTDDGDVMKAFCTPIVIDVNGEPLLISPTSKAALAHETRFGRSRVASSFMTIIRNHLPSSIRRQVSVYQHRLRQAKLLGGKPHRQGRHHRHEYPLDTSQIHRLKPSTVLIDGRLSHVVHDQGVLRVAWTVKAANRFGLSS
ncbi:MAG: hypothetical protein R3C28_06275 [Pirellulaceae bacterium]